MNKHLIHTMPILMRCELTVRKRIAFIYVVFKIIKNFEENELQVKESPMVDKNVADVDCVNLIGSLEQILQTCSSEF